MRAAQLLAVVATAVLAGPGLTACSPVSNSQPCMPPPFSLSEESASPGGSLTVQAKDADCNPRYGEDAQIHIEVLDSSGTKLVELQAPMNDAGGFSAKLTLPETAAPGLGSVSAYPYNLDWCDDTGKNNRVARAGIERVSCAQPVMPLTIKA